MSAQSFWSVISQYNSQTVILQIALGLFLIIALLISYFGKAQLLAKLAFGTVFLFIGIVYFGIFGTEPIQIYLAMPLYLGSGCLFIYEAIKNWDDKLERPNKWQLFLLILYIAYPFISYARGSSFPQMATYIMPCPVISLSIAVYSGYRKKNILLMALLTLWGLTGVKSLIFNAYEDIILLICGMYGVYSIYMEVKNRKYSV